MMVVLTYDVNVIDTNGEKRLRNVAKVCEKYGVRVQNSVFELLVDPAQLTTLKAQLKRIIDPSRDSIRFYRLGKSFENKIEVIGRTPLLEQGKPIIL
ncbi:MAG TPA: CRISPR-associated endonuclease Cas2 [Clostridiales bacterium]|jgi:CRISPR-associated protein Cas2|nr:CRISPR-associated endonuclease Cas2 [Clostridiales bacterium]